MLVKGGTDAVFQTRWSANSISFYLYCIHPLHSGGSLSRMLPLLVRRSQQLFHRIWILLRIWLSRLWICSTTKRRLPTKAIKSQKWFSKAETSETVISQLSTTQLPGVDNVSRQSRKPFSLAFRNATRTNSSDWWDRHPFIRMKEIIRMNQALLEQHRINSYYSGTWTLDAIHACRIIY